MSAPVTNQGVARRETRAGSLAVLGLGPGPAEWVTPAVRRLIGEASDLVGYGPYLDRLPPGPQIRHPSDNRVELDRARQALALAAAGARVAVVSGGDPGVFAMASAVFEAVEFGEPAWRHLNIVVEPGVSAMLAAASRLGAPLGHDFAVLSLSDNLKPFALIERRVRAAATAGFALACYNPVSKARPGQLDRVFAILCEIMPADLPIAFCRAIGRPDERIALVPLAEARAEMADMATLVLVGTVETRRIARPGARDWLYTPRRSGNGSAGSIP